MTPRLVSVALNRPLPEPYAYEVPAELSEAVAVGMLVEVPLGTTTEIGCIVQVDPPIDPSALFRLRPINRIVAGSFRLEPEIIDLCRWLAGYYFCSLGEALATASMIGFADVTARIRTAWRLASEWGVVKLTDKQRAAAQALPPGGDFDSVAAIAQAAGCSSSIAKKLTESGVLESYSIAPEDLTSPLPSPDAALTLSDEQQAAFDTIQESLLARQFGVFLLHGVTGSGKTEVYLRLIAEALARGQTALCLVPEIALTPQTVERFARRFQEEVGIFHSQMTKLEKRVLWEKLRAGRVRLVIGARSAAFAPLPNLGIIIVDEEHESSYKQNEAPRYHARDLLVYRASRLSIPIVLGSATPSLESYDNALKGKYRLLKLTHRPAGFHLPEVRVISLGREAMQNPDAGFTMFSQELLDGIRSRLERREQTILFLNRRGFSNFLMCSNCRWVSRCHDDDIVLTIHRRGAGKKKPHEDEVLELFPGPLDKSEASLRCHFCGTWSEYPQRCPECGEDALVALGAGTQRIEEALVRQFPTAKILRLDQDTVNGRQAWLKAWQQMVSGEAEIILGTQMIAKGLHLERVTLVGVILADIGLYIPDFRAEERVFSLLMQVSGRAGRGNMGEVLVQTYMPRHAGIQMAAKHDYEGFFHSEMERRRKLRFPPVDRLVALTISDNDRTRAINAARQLGSILRRRVHQIEAPRPAVFGPQSAPVERLANRFRQRILLRGPAHRPIASLISRSLADEQWRMAATTRLAIDVDPQDLL